jgi:alkanesulfonate monooxygenase SsuD/methylene tetrahydromethanopterin reductase-like flavin-dependent oxidoreductase (luciferase family)
MTTLIILSIQIPAQAPLADPALAARVGELADECASDLLVLGEPADASAQAAFDPLLLAPWVAARARGVGVVPVVSALHSEPFHVARALSALDLLSQGRCGWMPQSSAVNWSRYGGVGEVAPAQFSAKAADFVAATRSLWDSWDSDALIIDQQSGAYLHSDRVRPNNHRGPYHVVRGPLNAARPSQGHPVLVLSERDLLAASAEPDVLIVDSLQVRQRRSLREVLRLPIRHAAETSPQDWCKQLAASHCDGLHLELGDAVADLEWFAKRVAPSWREAGLLRASGVSDSLRTRFQLPRPMTASERSRAGAPA